MADKKIDYGDPGYWDLRYQNYDDTMFDWLETWSSLKSILEKHIKPEHKILVLGCGNANFSEDMYDAGY